MRIQRARIERARRVSAARWRTAARTVAIGATLAGCWKHAGSEGGGQISQDRAAAPRPAARDVEVPPGYRIELVARGLTFPTGVDIDESGAIFVAESGYSYGEVTTTARLVEIDPETGAVRREIASGAHAPWSGVDVAGGVAFIAQGGALDGDREDEGWLERQPDFHDVPCRDVTLAGVDLESGNPLTWSRGASATRTGWRSTGAARCWSPAAATTTAAAARCTAAPTGCGGSSRGAGTAGPTTRAAGRSPTAATTRAAASRAAFLLAQHPGTPPEPLARLAVQWSGSISPPARSRTTGDDQLADDEVDAIVEYVESMRKAPATR